MTSTTNTPQDKDGKAVRTLEEICENTRAIRRVVNRILDHLHESQEQDDDDDDPYSLDWGDLDNYDDMYY